jgi:hypothetical protein
MFPSQEIQQVEAAFGFRYPPLFLSAVEELRCAFPEGTVLSSAAEISQVCELAPKKLLPFMTDRYRQNPEDEWSDIYAFDLNSEGPDFGVVVWCYDAIVFDWPTFSAFLLWVREKVEKPSTE